MKREIYNKNNGQIKWILDDTTCRRKRGYNGFHQDYTWLKGEAAGLHLDRSTSCISCEATGLTLMDQLPAYHAGIQWVTIALPGLVKA